MTHNILTVTISVDGTLVLESVLGYSSQTFASSIIAFDDHNAGASAFSTKDDQKIQEFLSPLTVVYLDKKSRERIELENAKVRIISNDVTTTIEVAHA